MQKYYHFTEYKYLDSIGELGLIPTKGNRSKSYGEDKTAVFVSEGVFPTYYMYYILENYYDYYSGENGISAMNTAYRLIADYNILNHKLSTCEVGSQEYNTISKIIESLRAKYQIALITLHRVEEINNYISFDDFWGDGVYLSISDIPNIDCYESLKHNCWTYDTIPPEKINVLLLRDKSDGQIIDSKEVVIYYLLSTLSLEDMRTEYEKMFGEIVDFESMITEINLLSQLLIDNKANLDSLQNNYELVEIPIKEYLKMKRDNDENAPTLKKTTNNN